MRAISANTGPGGGAYPRRPGRAARLAAASMAAAAVVLFGTATPALAHGGPIRLEVSGDGADRVITVATWKNDGHPVTEPVELTLIATPAPGGPPVGPIRMVSSAEGQSFYTAQRPLPKGAWRVTVTATSPAKATATKIIALRGPPRSLLPKSRRADTGDGALAPAALIAGVAATLALFIGAVWWRSRRRPGD